MHNAHNNGLRNGVGIAIRVLLINSVISIFAFVAQVTSLVAYGPTHDYWLLYVTLVLTMFIASLVTQWIVRKSLFAGMNFYAWVCYACVVGMVVIDRSVVRTGFPLILFTLMLGVLGLGLTVGYAGSVPFAAVCCVTVLGTGIMSENVDAGIVASTLIAATAAMSSENARTAKKLDKLETAVEAYIDAKRQYREEHRRDTAVDRGV